MKTKYNSQAATGSRCSSPSARLGWLVILLVWVLGLPSVLAASISTDQADYAPFTYVTITGTGFQPGESVNNQVIQVAGPAAGTVYAPWTVQADTNGNFTTSWLVFTDDLIGTTLQVTSTGQTSGLSANTTFTDAITCPSLPTGTAQVLVPPGGFGIDGDLKANSPVNGIGDWLPDASGAGGVLNASGCPLNSLTTYHLIDAANNPLDNNFNSGKANDNPNTWTWVLNPVGKKVDLKHALIHASKDANGHTWLTIAATRESNTGDAYVDFEFLQNSLSVVTNAAGTGGSFSSAGPNGGRTINDFVLSITLTGGGSTPSLCVYRWNQVGVDNLGNPTYDYTNATSVLPANAVFGAMNTAPVTIPNCYSNVVDTYAALDFAEVAVDITAMISGFDPCATASIGTVFVKSKQSQSPTASLGDFITPQPISQPFVIGPAAFAGPNQSKCTQGASTTFNMAGSAQQGTFPLSSTNWSAISGYAHIDNPASLTPTVTIYGAGTNVTLRLTVTDSGTCYNSSQHSDVVLTVNPNPSVTVNSPVTCSGTPATVQASVSIGTGPFVYAWTVPATASKPGNVDHFSTTVPGTYSVVITDANGCTSASASGTVTINPTPSATVNSPITCAGIAATIQASVSGGTGPFAYAWTVPAGASDPGNVDHFSATVPGSYSVVVTDANSCSSASASGTLAVNPTPSVTVNNPTTCAGSPATIQASVTGGTGPFTYAWTVPAPASNPGNVDHFTATVPGSYSVVVTDVNNCSSASASGTLTFTLPPSVTVNSPTTCAGIPATIQASISSGTGPFSYVWTVPATASNPGNVDHFNAAVAGSYSVVLIDANGCASSQASGTLTVNPIPGVTVNSPSTCSGSSATIQASVTGGTGPYSYAWTVPNTVGDPGNIDHFSATVAGSYSVVVTDAKGCVSAQVAGTLTVNPTPSVTVNSPAVCGGSPAVVQATVSSGTAPFSYAWTVPATVSNPGSVDHFSATVAGSYSVVVTDAKGCVSAQASGILTVNPTPSVTVSSPTTCAGSPATIQASVTSGTGPFSYAWTVPNTVSDPGNVDHFSATVEGSYSVVVTDAKSCVTAQASGTLTVNPTPSVTLNSPTTCAGSPAMIQATVTSGTSPFSYAWTVPATASNPGNVDHFSATVAGAYSVVVTDAKGCVSAQASGTLTVNPIPSVIVNSPTTCASSSAAIQASVTGGTGPFSYVWTVPNTVSDPGNVDHFNATVAGAYSVVVTDTKGCVSAQASGTLTVNPTPSVTVNSPTTCAGSPATIQASVTGGTGPVSYTWTVPNTASDPGNVSHFSATVGGSYSVVVTDAKGCVSAQASGTLTVNPTPSVTVNSPTICAGTPATIQALVTSGTAPFSYAWTVPATVSNPGNVDHFSATVAGSYSVVVTDAKGCVSAQASGTLTVNPTPSVTVNSPTTCAGSPATIQANVSSGTSPFSYAWAVPNTVSDPGNVDHFSAIMAGAYSVVVTDAKGCVSAQASGTLTVNPTPSVTVNSPTTCAGSPATVQANVSSGTSPFSYAWTVPATASNPGNVDHFSASVAGSYSVVVTDAKGCVSAQASGTLTVNPTASVTVNSPTTCAGSPATIQATVTGGAGPFTYAWTVPAGASNPGSVDHFSATVAGSYKVVVTDANSCGSTSASGTLTVNPTPGVTVNSPTTCAGTPATIQATVSSGTGPFSYAWTVPNTASDPGNVDHFSATVAGSYSVVVTDAKGCVSTQASGTLTVNPTPSVTVNSPTTCAGTPATIQATVSSGTAPFSYAWTVPATASNPGNVDHFNATVAGSYKVVVTDAKGCVSAQGTGTLTANPSPSVSAAVTQPACNAGTGSITASGSGGTWPYMYSLNTGAFQTLATFGSLSPNTYMVTVKDANGCTGTTTVSVIAPTAISLTAKVTQPKCSTDTGSIIASATGGTGTITYSMDGSIFQTSGTFTGLPAGPCTITAKDANGCTATTSLISINPAPAPMALSLTTNQPQCSTAAGSITAAASGGVSPYTYSINGTTFQTSGTFSGLQANTYTITAKDSNGCLYSQTATITQPPPLSCTMSGLSDVEINSTANTITAMASGGTPPYSFTWKCNDSNWPMTSVTPITPSASLTSSTITYAAPAANDTATFTVTTTDANGCTAVCTITVASLPPSFVTDSSLCTFTSPFRLIFTQDPTNMPCYKLTASNPGQFYYNMTYLGTHGEPSATFSITLPYPFVTQGAQPIHAYDSVSIQNSGGQTCLTPGNTLYSSGDQVTLASYGPNPVVGVSTYTFTETVPLSAYGYAYLNIHLDYGLKKAGGYSPGGTGGHDAVSCAGSPVIPIPDLQADGMFYNFSYIVGNVIVNTLPGVQSANDWQKNPGVAGLVSKSSTQNPVAGATVVLKDPKGNILGTAQSNTDGWYVISYKSTGRATKFSVILTAPGTPQTDTITLKANGFAEADFVVP